MQTTWVVAADSSRTRIFEVSPPGRHLNEIADFANPQARAANRELRSDGEGRYAGGGDREQAHTAESHVDAVTHETELYSKQVSEYLDKARKEHRYAKLRLIAPPKFLGMIRQNLSREAQKLVEEELVKDVSWFDAKEIEDYLEKMRH